MAGFDGTGYDLELTFHGFDIDSNNEVEVFLNGDSIVFLDVVFFNEPPVIRDRYCRSGSGFR